VSWTFDNRVRDLLARRAPLGYVPCADCGVGTLSAFHHPTSPQFGRPARCEPCLKHYYGIEGIIAWSGVRGAAMVKNPSTAWELPAAPERWPAPVRVQDVPIERLPTKPTRARTLAKRACLNGWTVYARSAEVFTSFRSKAVATPVPALSLHMRQDEGRRIITWILDSFEGCLAWGDVNPCHIPYDELNFYI
jgi:hypothetical protein